MWLVEVSLKFTQQPYGCVFVTTRYKCHRYNPHNSLLQCWCLLVWLHRNYSVTCNVSFLCNGLLKRVCSSKCKRDPDTSEKVVSYNLHSQSNLPVSIFFCTSVRHYFLEFTYYLHFPLYGTVIVFCFFVCVVYTVWFKGLHKILHSQLNPLTLNCICKVWT